MKNVWTIIVVATIVVMWVVGCKAPNAAETGASKEIKTDAPKEEEKPVAISAETLTAEYEENELAADGKYKDKVLAVSGKISSIAETFGSVTVQMEGKKIMPNVICTFDDEQRAAVAKLKKGQKITMIGQCEGSTGGLYVGLNECRIE